MKDLNETTNTAPDAAKTGLDADFKKCLKLERDRERSRRESAQGKFEASRRCPTWDAARKQYFAHLEKLLNFFCGQ